MSSSADVAAHPVVTALRAVADALVELPLCQLSAAEASNVLADVEIERRRVEYGWLRVLPDFYARGISAEEAGLPSQALLGLRLRLSH